MRHMLQLPDALPCGCRLKNRQGKTISGAWAPTQLAEDGTRHCRCGILWKAQVHFTRVRSSLRPAHQTVER